MSQISSGVRAIFSRPAFYDAFQALMGARRGRRELVERFIRPEPRSRVLDLGCGTAEILDFLPHTVEYWGYDSSVNYISSARTRFGSRGHFRCAEVSRATLEGMPRFDVVLMIGLLHHLDDAAGRNALGLARDALAREGRLVTVDPCLAEGQNPVARCLIKLDRGQSVRDACGYRALATTCFPEVSGTLLHRRWIPYTHWIMECSV